MSLQATAGDRCSWTADLISAQTVAQNDGVVTGVLVFNKGTTAVASSKIVYGKTRNLLSNVTKCSFHIKGFKTTSVSGTGYIVSKYNAGDGIQLVIMQYNNYLRVYVSAGGAIWGDTAAATIVADTKYDIDVVYDGTLAAASRLAIYMNAVSKAVSINGTIPTSLGKNNARIAVFGYDDASVAKEGVSVEDVWFFNNYALSQAEVTDLYERDTIPELSQPLIDLPLRSSYYKENGVELVVGSNMELANWTAGNNATLSNPETGVLRVAYNGTNNPFATQTILTSAKRYKFSVDARAGAQARLLVGNVQFDLTTTGDWQTVSGEVTAANTTFIVQSIGSSGYVEFRNATVELMECLTENRGSLKGTAKLGDGSTTTTMPTQLYPKGYRSTGQYLKQIATLPSGTYSVIALIKPTAVTSKYIFDCRADSGTGYLWFSGTDVISASAGTVYRNGRVATGLTGKNGVVQTIGVTGITLDSTSIYMMANYLAANGLLGDLLDIKFFSGTLTPQQMSIEHTKMMKLLNV